MAPGETLMIEETVETLLSWETGGEDGSVEVALDAAMPRGMQLSVRVISVGAAEGGNCGVVGFEDFLSLSDEAPLELVTGIEGATCIEGEARLEFRLEVVNWEEFRGELDEQVTLVYEYVTESI